MIYMQPASVNEMVLTCSLNDLAIEIMQSVAITGRKYTYVYLIIIITTSTKLEIIIYSLSASITKYSST